VSNEKNWKMMIVDDEIDLHATLKFIFEDNGFDVEMAVSGIEALKKIKEERFDVILLDLCMPEMNGLQTFREIKKISPSTAVFMMTGNKESSQLKKCIDEGAITAVYKPFSVNNLLEIMNKVVKRPVVLVVDDRGDDRTILRNALEIHDFRIVEASSGFEAVEKAQRGDFDICLIDYRMPGMNGIDTIEKVRDIAPEAALVLVSAFTLEDAIKKELKQKKGVTFLKKPFEINNLVDIIKGEGKGRKSVSWDK